MNNVIVDIDSDRTIVHIRIDSEGHKMTDSDICDALYHICLEFNTKANLESQEARQKETKDESSKS